MTIDQSYEVKRQRSTSKQLWLGLIAYFSHIAPSMSLGFSAVALPALQDPANPYKLNDDEASWVASIAAIATPAGCFISGPISDRYGRKKTLLCINIVAFIGWLVIAAAYYFPEAQYPVLLTGRLITGLSTGVASMPAAVYMAEISSPQLRGMFTTASAIFFGLGILVVYILGYFFQENWGTLSLISAAIPCFSFACTYFMLPESPTWLVLKNRVQKARVNMSKIYGFKDVTPGINDEIEILLSHRSQTNSGDGTKFEALLSSVTKNTFWKPFVMVLAYFFFMQFSGTFVVVFYAIHIVKDAGVTFDPYLAIILVGATRVFAAAFVSYISRSYGRRPLSLISGAGMTICMIILASYVATVDNKLISEDTVNKLSLLPIILLIIYFFTSTLGFLTMPFAINAEVFPTKVRGLGTGLTTCFAYVFNFITVKIYPEMVETMTKFGVFTFYGAVSLLGTIFIYFFLLETKGKTLQEIEEHFEGRRRNETPIKT